MVIFSMLKKNLFSLIKFLLLLKKLYFYSVRVNSFNADKIRVKQNSASDYLAQLQNGEVHLSGSVKVSKKFSVTVG